VHILTTAVDTSLPRHAIVEGVPVTRIPVDVTSTLSKLRAARRMLVELVRLARRSDLVHVHGFSTKNVLVTAVARALGNPIVLSLHTSGFDEPPAIRRQGALAWWSFTAADLYLSVSPVLVDACVAAGLPADRIRLVPNGIDTERFAPATAVERQDARRQLLLADDRPVIVFVGFFSRDKQPRVLFDAWLRLRGDHGIETTLVFVGATSSAYFEVDATLADQMRADAELLGVSERVVFAGVSHDVPAYLRAADLFALPSRREGLPVALLEAMSCGLPCVASRLPGATDEVISDGENGRLVPVGDVEAFAGAMADLLRDRLRASAMGAAARATIERLYASADVADRWLSAYGQIFPMAFK